jgi:hypothetical protein
LGFFVLFAVVILSLSTPGKLKSCLAAMAIEPATFALLISMLY